MPRAEAHRIRTLRPRLADLVALLPVSAVAALLPFVEGSPEGRYRALLGGLVVAIAVGGFATRTGRDALVRVPLAAVLIGIVPLAHPWAGAPALTLLFLAVGAAASGLAVVGRRIGTPAAASGGVACVVLYVACLGLFWADPVAARLERSARHPLRQAALHADPALALAYDGAAFDRLRSPGVYFEVPLASSLIERPRAVTTGGTWLALGLLAWTVAACVRGRVPPAEGPTSGGSARA